MSIIVTEKSESEEKQDCCPLCGSLGVIHFEDATTTPDMQHRCLRCNGGWDGCLVSSADTPIERLNSAEKKS